ncbi:MAG: prepilin peptidase, partial [Actinomycetes bacterium]
MSDATWTAVLSVFAVFLGLSVGSFLNVVIHRVPRGLSIIRPRSFCPSCDRELTSRENAPVLS